MKVGRCAAFVFFLAAVVFGGTASAQLTAADIAELQNRAKDEGWSFTVGETSATRRPPEALFGLKQKPADWRTKARFVGVKAKDIPPDSFDWRPLGGCTPVRDQGYCGSCWAFGTVGPLESAILIHENVEVDLAEQWLVSCNQSGWSCGGGYEAFDYFLEADGLTDQCGGSGAVIESDFPYGASDLACACPYDHPFKIKSWAYISGWDDIPAVSDIKQAIMTYGPVCAAVYVNDAFQAYTGGVFGGTACEAEMVNHQIVLVGWNDSLGARGAWILRNSWGEEWGENGYMYIEYGCCNVGLGACFIEYEPRDNMQVSPYGGFNSSGDRGGPFSPVSQQYTLHNAGPAPVNWEATCGAEWVTLSSPTSGWLAAGASAQVTATINDNANSMADGGHTAVILFKNITSGIEMERRVHLYIVPPPFYEELLDTDPQWTAQPGWSFGAPGGICGDPAAAHTGGNVYGFASGCYTPNMPQRTLTTTAINCLGYKDVSLEFWRWLGVEPSFFDAAAIKLSTDGSNWRTIWANSFDALQDTDWVKCTYDISAIADNESTLYVQWAMGPTDEMVQYSGWNIDDLRLRGVKIDDLMISPNYELSSSGYPGGPFNPTRVVYTLFNSGGAPLQWHASKTLDCLTLMPQSGTLAPGGSTQVLVAVNEQCNGLAVGAYTDTVTITNITSGVSQTRAATVNVNAVIGAGQYFTEAFEISGNDLSYTTLTLTPDGSAASYSPCVTPAASLPIDPASGTHLYQLLSDECERVVLSGSKKVVLYGREYDRFFVSSNGYITFTGGDLEWWPSLEAHFDMPRISGFFSDLFPIISGTITWQQLSDRAVVTYENVPQLDFSGTTPPVTFQIEMFFDGVIRITWLEMNAPFGLAGISKGTGVPSDYVPSDISAMVRCGGNTDDFAFVRGPASKWAVAGQSWRTDVAVTGTFGPIFYQWTKDGEPMQGRNAAELIFPSLVIEDSASYTCIVTDDVGQHESAAGVLEVYAAGEMPGAGLVPAGLAALLLIVAAAVLLMTPARVKE